MEFSIKKKAMFHLCGFYLETSLETCGPELHRLWEYYGSRKKELFDLFGERKDFYGLMWTTTGSRYCYLIGIETDGREELPEGAVTKTIPAAEYAVASVPSDVSAFDAWANFYYKVLPAAGYTPNAGHGFDFEYYPNGDGAAYELWTPVTKKPEISTNGRGIFKNSAPLFFFKQFTITRSSPISRPVKSIRNSLR